MGTLKQKKTAKRMVENLKLDRNETGGEMLENVGYSKGVTEYPSRVLKSEGVKEELEVLGFTIEAADKVVEVILQNDERPDLQLRASDTIYKRLGAYSPEKKVVLNANVDIKEEDESIAIKYEEELRDNFNK